MIKYEFEPKRMTSLEVCGDLNDLASETLYMISLIYDRIYRSDPQLGIGYRAMITAGILSPDSPVFQLHTTAGNVRDICMIVPKTGGGGKENTHE